MESWTARILVVRCGGEIIQPIRQPVADASAAVDTVRSTADAVLNCTVELVNSG
eukprot:COSAG06_NODE_54580_length_294_cov_0.369231_1_plen_53_part_01